MPITTQPPTMKPGTTITNEESLNFKKASLVFRALNHKLRGLFMSFISSKNEVTVTQLYIHFRIEQSVASQHLHILRKAGCVKTRREGKFIYYSINETNMAKYGSLAQAIVETCNS
jgi:DNA-binding transcriptional ArsR family regulator